MPHFLIKNEEIKDDFIELNDSENFFHIVKVLRTKVNEKLKFIDENKIVYETTVVEVDKKNLKAKIEKKYKTDRILKNNLSLVLATLMTDAQNLAIANATQCGVKTIYPVISDNCSVSEKSLNQKVEKWAKIVNENFKQCERGDIVKISEIAPLKETLLKFKKENVLIFAEKYENISIENSLKDIDKTSEIVVVIGPEGGFSNKEFDFFIKENYKLISLGKMIFKAPNAVVAGISNIVSRIE